MFAYWHFLRMCAQPAKWSVRMLTALLFAAVISAAWKISEFPLHALTGVPDAGAPGNWLMGADLSPGSMLSGLMGLF